MARLFRQSVNLPQELEEVLEIVSLNDPTEGEWN